MKNKELKYLKKQRKDMIKELEKFVDKFKWDTHYIIKILNVPDNEYTLTFLLDMILIQLKGIDSE